MPPASLPVMDGAALDKVQPEIVVDSLVLRRWGKKDAQQLVDAFRDEAIRSWALHPLDTQDEAERWISRWKFRWRERQAASWAISHVDDRGTVLGQVAFRALYLADGLAECSYWVAPGWRRQGVAARATTMLSDWALGSFGLERLELVHSTRNEPSCGVADAAGYQLEGTLRRLQRYGDGWHDMHLHSRIRTAEPAPEPTPGRRPGPRWRRSPAAVGGRA